MLLSLAVTLAVGLVYLWTGPAFGLATYQYRGKAAHTVALPFIVPTEADWMDVSFVVRLRPVRFGTFRVTPDDCIEQLTINNRIVDGRLANFCDYVAGRSSGRPCCYA